MRGEAGQLPGGGSGEKKVQLRELGGGICECLPQAGAHPGCF